MRYVVVGTSGSGKTTFARKLAAVLDIPCMELDSFHWGPNWTPRPLDEFVQAVEQAASDRAWVMDGNYSAVRPIVWSRATHVIWLNFDRTTVFGRILRRSLWRTVSREKLWSGNRESFRRTFFSRDSILVWSMATFSKNRARYGALREDPDCAHLAWHEVRTPSNADVLLHRLGSAPAQGPAT